MNCFRRWVFTPKIENIIKYQIIRGIFQFRRKSLFDDSNGDVSPVFAWRFWRKFLAMGSTGNGAALGCFQSVKSGTVDAVQAPSDDKGMFNIPEFPEKQYILEVYKPGYLGWSSQDIFTTEYQQSRLICLF